MRRTLSFAALLGFLLVLCFHSLAQTPNSSSAGHKILIDSMVISGTQAIDSSELAEMTDALSGSEFDDDPEELQERVRDQFQNHGYFQVEVEKFEMKVIDPLASPKPVRVEAEVKEGPLCRLSNIEFTGNHALSSEELRGMFPLKTGEVFKKAKIAGGLQTMMKALASRGFLDAAAVLEPTLAARSVRLGIALEEGHQYRMGKLEIVGPSEVAEKLQARWELEPGAIFDASYIRNFLDSNNSLLPAGFVESDGVRRLENCGDSTVSIHLQLVPDAQHDAQGRAKQVDCGETDRKKKS
jgi:outer membrane protein assembly factor BamA